MATRAPNRWRPLTIGDVAFLLSTEPDYVKKWIKKGIRYGIPIVPPRWVSTSDQRLWAWTDLDEWARQYEVKLRPLADLDAQAERRRAALGWQTVEAAG